MRLRRRRSAFTLVETICVCVILAVLSSLLMPVYQGAMRSAHTSAAMGNLQQLYIAFALYRTEHDGDGRYGSPAEMGLPDFDQLKSGSAIKVDPRLWEPACGPHPDIVPRFAYVYGVENDDYSNRYFRENEESSALLIDENCTDHSLRLYSSFDLKVLLGLRLSGQVQKVVTYNYPDSLINWVK